MKKLRIIFFGLFVSAMLLVGVSPTMAVVTGELKTGTFNGQFDQDGFSGGGDGWDAGNWLLYDQAGSQFWWNQWWYNDPPDPNRWKWVEVKLDYELMDPGIPGNLWVTVNWSTLEFPATGPSGPPPMPNQEIWIGRLGPPELLGLDPSGPDTGHWESGVITLPVPYNPEWVSIDVWGENMVFSGTIDHQCVPIPGTLWILGSGLTGILGFRRRIKAKEILC